MTTCPPVAHHGLLLLMASGVAFVIALCSLS